MTRQAFILSLVMWCLILPGCASTSEVATSQSSVKKIKVLIVDGQNNHWIWPKSTAMMRQYLQEPGLFDVDIYRTRYTWKGDKLVRQFALHDGKNYQSLPDPKTDPEFAPVFTNYDVVISNFGWRAADWPQPTKLSFESYMKEGGGLVVIHAADNSFPDWPAFNQMIGLGGWGDRNETSGPYVYFNDQGELIRDFSKGVAGGHGEQHRFTIELRNTEHPITQGLSIRWLHSQDELYNRLRGPAENMTVLATAYDDKKLGGSGRHEPVLMTINYHQGRIFHSTLGHGEEAFQDAMFIKLLLRGTEWAATGRVLSE